MKRNATQCNAMERDAVGRYATRGDATLPLREETRVVQYNGFVSRGEDMVVATVHDEYTNLGYVELMYIISLAFI